MHCLQAAEDVSSVQGHHNDSFGATALGHLPLALWGGEQPLVLTPLHTLTDSMLALVPKSNAASVWYCIGSSTVPLLDYLQCAHGHSLMIPHGYERFAIQGKCIACMLEQILA